MMLFTLQTVDRMGNTVPAVLFSNSIFNKTIMREKFGDSCQITGNFSCDADPSQVPLEVILYSQQQEIDLVNENLALNDEVAELKSQIIELTSKLSSVEVNSNRGGIS